MRRPWLLVLVGAAAAGSARPVARLRRTVDVPEWTLLDVLSPQARLAGQLEVPQPEPEPELQVCEIACWRGYVTWQFYVESEAPLGVFDSSAYFRARGRDTPERADATLRAHAALVEQLTAAGWEPDGRGEHWYSDRFRPS
jgi:hypothetical protein